MKSKCKTQETVSSNKACYKNWSVMLTTHVHLVLRLRMYGAIPPLLQYVFMAKCLIKQEICLHGMVLS